MLDSANFNAGSVTITKSVSIQAIPGQVGSIVAVAGTPAITIPAAVHVTLRNLAIVTNANNPGADGVVVSAGGVLTVEDSAFNITNAYTNSSGIRASGTNTRLAVHNSVFRESYVGVFVSDSASAEISRSKFTNCTGSGVYVAGLNDSTTTNAVIADSAFSHNYQGVWVEGDSVTAITHASVVRSSFAHNTFGVASVSVSGATTVTTLGNNNITNNTLGYYQNGAGSTMESTGHNTIRNNVGNQGGITSVPEV